MVIEYIVNIGGFSKIWESKEQFLVILGHFWSFFGHFWSFWLFLFFSTLFSVFNLLRTVRSVVRIRVLHMFIPLCWDYGYKISREKKSFSPIILVDSNSAASAESKNGVIWPNLCIVSDIPKVVMFRKNGHLNVSQPNTSGLYQIYSPILGKSNCRFQVKIHIHNSEGDRVSSLNGNQSWGSPWGPKLGSTQSEL